MISDIKSIVNGRHSEMFQGEPQQVYLAAFFLDFRMFLSMLAARALLLTGAYI